MNAVAESLLHPQSIDDVVHCVRDHRRLRIVGASSKHAMTAPHTGTPRCVMTGVSGIVDHEPAEFLISALAGTRISVIQSALAVHGQYLPFDPPFASLGATIGGTVAAGLSGAGRLRFGGLRDFIVGIKIVDGLGKLVTGGGRVVKNAAGYDLPKLMIGSAGSLGAIVEVTLKVFPMPTHHRTVCVKAKTFPSAVKLQSQLSRSPIDLAAIDLTPDGTLWLRIEGEESALGSTTDRIQKLINDYGDQSSLSNVDTPEDAWRPLADGSFAATNERLVRVPITPSCLVAFNTSLEELSVQRRYSVAGNLAWIAWPATRPIQQLDECLRYHNVGATVLRGDVPRCQIGARPNASMMKRVKTALDPEGRFDGCQ
jgi:glycolate oxidase FAD binding subunit